VSLITTLRTAPTRPPRANVLGVGVHALNLPSALDFIEASIANGRKGYVCVTGVHGVMEAQRSPRLRAVLDNALLVTPDGMPTVWVGRLQGHRKMGRVFGPDLMRELCARSVKNGFRHFLYGGTQGTATKLRMHLEERFPGIQIAGTYTPPFRPLSQQERERLRNAVAELKPHVIWVGLSTPKQEYFMADAIDELDCRIMVGVGAAFDIHTGQLRDAPAWMKSMGMQWMHRLFQEPRRLWKRYLINNPAFLISLLLQFCGVEKYQLGGSALDHVPDQ